MEPPEKIGDVLGSAILARSEVDVMPAEYANKYEQQAQELAQSLEGTKWSAALTVERPARGAATRVAEFIQLKPITAMALAAAASFVLGAAWVARR